MSRESQSHRAIDFSAMYSKSSIDSHCTIPIPHPPSLSPNNKDSVVSAIPLAQARLDPLVAGGRHILAHEIGADRQLAVAAIDQHGQLNARRPAQVGQGIERSAN